MGAIGSDFFLCVREGSHANKNPKIIFNYLLNNKQKKTCILGKMQVGNLKIISVEKLINTNILGFLCEIKHIV